MGALGQIFDRAIKPLWYRFSYLHTKIRLFLKNDFDLFAADSVGGKFYCGKILSRIHFLVCKKILCFFANLTSDIMHIIHFHGKV
jgi:hypothetical protein